MQRDRAEVVVSRPANTITLQLDELEHFHVYDERVAYFICPNSSASVSCSELEDAEFALTVYALVTYGPEHLGTNA